MLKNISVSLLALLLSACGPLIHSAQLSVSANSTNEACESFQSIEFGEVNYCLRDSARSPDLIVFFHGLGLNQYAWNSPMAGKIDQSFKNAGIDRPSILVVSFGRLFFLNSNARDRDAIKVFANELQDKIAVISSHRTYRKKILYGDSMGGANALQVFLRKPDAFDALAIRCPALTNTSPFDSNEEWLAQAMVEHAVLPFSFGFRFALRHFYGGETNWDENSPLRFLETKYHATKNPQPIYLGVVKDDYYGFSRVQDRLETDLEKAGHKVIRTDSVNRHCNIETDSLVEFFTSLHS